MAKILIVDDDQTLLALYSELLKGEGYEIDLAIDGEGGLEKASRGGYDLILLDVNLPKRDGLSIVKDLKEKKPLSPNGKICFLTNAIEVVDREEVESLGITSLLKSSLTPEQFLSEVKGMLG